mmetsp:Transcript_2192/g.8471  ORF Transcript_2192/g.8471 Transcript_2192/m.8471 type:complete len:221 (+) Transcript_2192:641-1303(+)
MREICVGCDHQSAARRPQNSTFRRRRRPRPLQADDGAPQKTAQEAGADAEELRAVFGSRPRVRRVRNGRRRCQSSRRSARAVLRRLRPRRRLLPTRPLQEGALPLGAGAGHAHDAARAREPAQRLLPGPRPAAAPRRAPVFAWHACSRYFFIIRGRRRRFDDDGGSSTAHHSRDAPAGGAATRRRPRPGTHNFVFFGAASASSASRRPRKRTPPRPRAAE